MSISKPIAALAAGCLLMASAAALAQTGGAARAGQPGRPGHGPGRAGADRLDREVGRGGPPRGGHREDGAPDRHAGQERRHDRHLAPRDGRADRRQEQAPGQDHRPPGEGRGPGRGRRVGVARDKRLNERKPDMVSAEEHRQARGRAQGRRRRRDRRPTRTARSPRPSWTWPSRPSTEHTIVAPFDGVIIKRMKNPGESVRANEAVVELGNLNKLRRQRLRPARLRLPGQGGPGRRDPAADHRRARRAAAHREEAIPRQDHLRRSADPAGRRDGGPHPRRVREPGRAPARLDGADDDLPDSRRRRGQPAGRRADADGRTQ